MAAGSEVSAAVLEVPHRFGQVGAQRGWIAAHLPAADLVVLPEAAVTGYLSRHGDFDLSPFAEERGGETERFFCELARGRGCALLAPLIEREGSRCYNSALFIDAAGQVLACYRKRHPWFPETWATPGELPLPLVAWRGLVLTVAICFDINFVLEESTRELAQADVLLFPSCWTEQRDSRRALLPEIASVSGCQLINANWGVGEPRIPSQGNSMIVSADGAIAGQSAGRCVARLTSRARTG